MLPWVRYGTIYSYVYCELDNWNAEDQANSHGVVGNYRFAHSPLRRNTRLQMLNVAGVYDAQLRLDTGTRCVSAVMKLKSLKFKAANLYNTMHAHLLNTTGDMIWYVSTFKSSCPLFGSELTHSHTSWLIMDGDNTILSCSPSPTPSAVWRSQNLRKPCWGR